MWRWQKVIGFDVCKIVILNGHDIQMTWQPPINMKVCVSILQIVLSNNVGFSSWVGSVFGNESFFLFFSSQMLCLKPFLLSGNKMISTAYFFFISDHQR